MVGQSGYCIACWPSSFSSIWVPVAYFNNRQAEIKVLQPVTPVMAMVTHSLKTPVTAEVIHSLQVINVKSHV